MSGDPERSISGQEEDTDPPSGGNIGEARARLTRRLSDGGSIPPYVTTSVLNN